MDGELWLEGEEEEEEEAEDEDEEEGPPSGSELEHLSGYID
jgi:hypothetical protein